MSAFSCRASVFLRLSPEFRLCFGFPGWLWREWSSTLCVWCRKQDFQVAASCPVTWQDRLSPPVGVSPMHTSLRVSAVACCCCPPSRSSTPWGSAGGGGVKRWKCMEFPDAGLVSVWTADVAAPVCLCAVRDLRFIVLFVGILLSPVLICTLILQLYF